MGAYAQNQIHVTGIVKDDKGMPSANSTVIIKGTLKGVTTNDNGAFSIDVPDQKTVLVFSSTGYRTQEKLVGTNTTFAINMATAVNDLNEVVV